MKTILIVDDNIAVRTMMKIVLNTNGFETLEADNGATALTMALKKNPDLIISDVMMDNVNGFMLYEMLQKEPATRKIPMLLITGAAQNSGAWNADPNVGYFQKPISMHDILAEVNKRLRVTQSLDDLKRRTRVKRGGKS